MGQCPDDLRSRIWCVADIQDVVGANIRDIVKGGPTINGGSRGKRGQNEDDQRPDQRAALQLSETRLRVKLSPIRPITRRITET